MPYGGPMYGPRPPGYGPPMPGMVPPGMPPPGMPPPGMPPPMGPYGMPPPGYGPPPQMAMNGLRGPQSVASTASAVASQVRTRILMNWIFYLYRCQQSLLMIGSLYLEKNIAYHINPYFADPF